MSLEDEILSKSCKERAHAISNLEKSWIADKSSYSNLIPTLLKEKNVVVLEQLIPSFKVLPYAADIAVFVIQNFKTPKLKPKVVDYLNCKKKQLDIQLLFGLLEDKNPRFVQCLLLYLIEYYNVQGLPTPEQIETIKKTLSNADASIRKCSVALMQIFYGRDKTVDLSDLKPIIKKEIMEGTSASKKKEVINNISESNTQKTHRVVTSTDSSFGCEVDKALNRNIKKEEERVIESEIPRDKIPDDKLRAFMENLEDKSWKIRLDALQQLQNSTYDLYTLTKEITRRLRDPNNMVFLLALNLVKDQHLAFEKEVLLQKLADKKLQERIKEANVIEVSKEDFSTQKNPEVLKMMIEILLYQKNKEFKTVVNQFSGSARKDLRDAVCEYADFCEGKVKTGNEQNTNTTNLNAAIDKTSVEPLTIIAHGSGIAKTAPNSPVKPITISAKTGLQEDMVENITRIDCEQNKNYKLPTTQEQQNVIQRFTKRYAFTSEKDYKNKLEMMMKDEERLVHEQDLLSYVYSVKEHNKVINLQFLRILSEQSGIDVFLLCETFVRTFTDDRIFEQLLSILQTCDEKKTILYFLAFIRKHKKGKLFECAVKILRGIIKNCSVDLELFDSSGYIGKEKQLLAELRDAIGRNNHMIRENRQKQRFREAKIREAEKKDVVNEHLDEQKIEYAVVENDKSINSVATGAPEVKVEQKDVSNDPGSLSGNHEEGESHIQNVQPFVQYSQRKKDGKDFENYFTEDIKTLFEARRIEASDFIIKHIFEEKECLCGRKESTDCCLRELISYFTACNYVLSSYEAEKLVQMIKDEKLLRTMERIYPKTKIMMLKNEMSNFKNHIGRSFRMREYNMSPLTKKNRIMADGNIKIGRLSIKNDTHIQGVSTFSLHNEVIRSRKLSSEKFDKKEGNSYYTITDKSFNDSLNIDGSLNGSPIREDGMGSPALSTRKRSLESSPRSFQKYELFRNSLEKRLSTTTQNDCLISDLNKKDKSVLQTIYERAKNDIASLFYVANSLVTGLVSNLDDKIAIDILMLLSSDKSFLSELDYMTLKMLHSEIIKDIQDKGGDILINLCLNAPVPLLIKVYLNILNVNKEIILKLIWRNSKRKYASEYVEIINVYECFFSTNPVLDEMSFKIVQLHVCELVREVGEKVLELPTSGVLRKILCGMLEHT